MRLLLTCLLAVTFLSTSASAADTGVPPRAASTNYPAQGAANAATIAAAVVPPSQVSKIFSPEISKQYVVVEVAIYPNGGVPFDVKSADFALRVGERVGHATPPSGVGPWPDRNAPAIRSPVDVTAEAGVIREQSDDPYYGHQQRVGTYTDVALDASGQRNVPLQTDPVIDPRVVRDRVRHLALAEGETKTAIAGYLYFPQSAKRRKSDSVELKYATSDVTVNLTFPK